MENAAQVLKDVNGQPVGYHDTGVATNQFAAALASFKPIKMADPAPATEGSEGGTDGKSDGATSADPASVSVTVVPTAEMTSVADPNANLPKKEKRRRHHKKSAKPAAAPVDSGMESAGGQTASATPPTQTAEKRSQVNERPRAPQFGGIRKIELAQVAPPVAIPRGSIGLRRFLRMVHPAQLTDLAKELSDKGVTPDVVVWAESASSFDLVRIKVVLEQVKKGKGGKPLLLSHLEIAEVTGKFGNLAEYIGQEIRFGEVMNFLDRDGKPRYQIPPKRVPGTVALNAVLLEVDALLKKAEERNKSPRPRPTAAQPVAEE